METIDWVVGSEKRFADVKVHDEDFSTLSTRKSIDFICGDIQRFSSFIKELGGDDNIALLTHTDLDGIASAKIVDEIVKPNLVRFLDYEELDMELLEDLKEKKINKIIMTDLYMNEYRKDFVKEMEKFAEVLMIDHHPFVEDWNSSRTVFMNVTGYCVAYMCYVLFSKVQNLETPRFLSKDLDFGSVQEPRVLDKLDWLVACACVSDWCCKENQDWMARIFAKYDDVFVLENTTAKAGGKIWDVMQKLVGGIIYFRKDVRNVFDNLGQGFGEVGDLEKYADEVEGEILEMVERFDREKVEIKDGWFWELPKTRFAIRAMVITTVSVSNWNKTIIFLGEGDDKYCHINARRQDKKIDTGRLLQKLIEGFKDAEAGGHVAASAGHFLIENKDEFIEKIRNL